ncbi:hypothetical protein F2P44_28530 [Massilia sp. CCM 8695]|uniref:Peptidase C39-like domain-containing protein n=1 Tax=Massilia frigida TaxID=2609281 RepID=A0ABX0NCM1_9BURK|nr:hypothetical protein [Massilia frigida]NHZ83191.1 hypothetical protein [Massilia frigida]
MLAYQQTFKNSCGAAALMCAAMELQVTLLPKVDSNPNKYWKEPGELRLTQYVEAKIYSITSGQPDTEPSDESPYSLPSNMAIAAKLLDLSMDIYLTGSARVNIVNKFKGEEEATLENGGHVHDESPPKFNGDERRLLVLANKEGGLHYVMQHFGEIMDPGEGEITTLENIIKGGYKEVGITIVLKRRSSSSSVAASSSSSSSSSSSFAPSSKGYS